MDKCDSYTNLLCRHRRSVWALCWMYADGDWERCRDLVQEVSLALWEHYGTLRPDAHPMQERAWVWWNTRRVLNHMHRGLRHRYEPLTPTIAERMAVESDQPLGSTDELLSLLGDDDREIVRLRLEGYSAAEIADRLGLNRNTVYQRIHRIVEQLREMYGYEG